MKVTLIIDPGNGRQERYESTSPGTMAVPGVFQVLNSAIANRSHEVQLITSAVKLLAEFANAVGEAGKAEA